MSVLFIDLAIAAILLFFVLRGVKRGLVLSLCGLLAIVVAFAGASIAARVGSPMVADLLEPRFASAIEEQLQQSIQASAPPSGIDPLTPDTVPLEGVLDALRDMGLYENLIDQVDRAVENGMTQVAASAAAKVAAAIAQSVAYLVIFLVCFFLITIAWLLLSHALDLVARLPGLHFLNKTGGAVFGLIQGVLLLFVAVWILQYSGKVVPEAAVEQTYLLKFFLRTTPADLIALFTRV